MGKAFYTAEELLNEETQDTSSSFGVSEPKPFYTAEDLLKESPYTKIGKAKPQEKKSRMLRALGFGVAQGVTTELPAMVGGAAEFVGEKTGITSLEEAGRSVKEWGEEKGKEWFGDPAEWEGLEKIVYEGSKMLAPSLIPAGIVTWGFRALKGLGAALTTAKSANAAFQAARLSGDVVKLGEAKAAAELAWGTVSGIVQTANKIGAGASGVLFGLSQAQSTIDSANQTADALEAEGRFEEATQARAAGQGWAPYLTGAIEATGEYFGTKYLTALFGLKEGVERTGKQIAMDFLKTLGVEISTEVGQQAGEAAVEKYSGARPSASPWQEALDVIGPTAFMTLLTGGFASAVNRIKDREKSGKDQPLADTGYGSKDISEGEIGQDEDVEDFRESIRKDIIGAVEGINQPTPAPITEPPAEEVPPAETQPPEPEPQVPPGTPPGAPPPQLPPPGTPGLPAPELPAGQPPVVPKVPTGDVSRETKVTDTNIPEEIFEGKGYKVTPVQGKKKTFYNFELEDSAKDALGIAKEFLQMGEGPEHTTWKKGEHEGGGENHSNFPSTNPDFFKNSGWKKEEVLNAIEKALNGKRLEKGQREMVEAAIGWGHDTIRDMKKATGQRDRPFDPEDLLKLDEMYPDIDTEQYTDEELSDLILKMWEGEKVDTWKKQGEKGQTSLLPEGEKKFELTPSEPTPEEEIQARKEKGEIAAPEKGEKPGNIFPEGKIPAPTTGKQRDIFGRKKEKKGQTADLEDLIEEQKKPKLSKGTTEGAPGNMILEDKDGQLYESDKVGAPIHGMMLEDFPGLKSEDITRRGIRDDNGEIVWNDTKPPPAEEKKEPPPAAKKGPSRAEKMKERFAQKAAGEKKGPDLGALGKDIGNIIEKSRASIGELDPDKYAKVKALLDKAWQEAQDAKWTDDQFVDGVYEVLGAKAQPYFEKWIDETLGGEEGGEAEQKGEGLDTGVGEGTPAGGRANAPPTGGKTDGGTGPKGVRPGLRVAGEELLPKPRETVAAGQYGVLSEEQRLAVNLALDAFDRGKAGFLLADGTGVGKTGTELVIAAEYAKKTGKPSLIITQNQQIIEGNFKPDAKIFKVDLKNVEIGTYDSLKSGKVGKKQYGVVIFDESHALKNLDSMRTMASETVRADHQVYATATPMDKPTGATYFLSKITGIPQETIQQRLGFKVTEHFDFKTNKTVRNTVLLKGYSWADVMANLVDMRNTATAEGTMIRREYPFFGEIQNMNHDLPQAWKEEERKIIQYWDNLIDRSSIPTARMHYSGQKTIELGRWLESKKIFWVYDMIREDLKNGFHVAVVAEGINDTMIKGLGTEAPGFISGLEARMRTEGDITDWAKIYGGAKGKKAAAEVARFQSGEVKLALITPGTGGVGINLDDTLGDKPRKVYIVTPNFAGDIFQQILGRFSRRNTASPADVNFTFYRGSFSDNRRISIAEKKIQTLRAIQEGQDLDTAYGFEETGEQGEDTDKGPMLFGKEVGERAPPEKKEEPTTEPKPTTPDIQKAREEVKASPIALIDSYEQELLDKIEKGQEAVTTVPQEKRERIHNTLWLSYKAQAGYAGLSKDADKVGHPIQMLADGASGSKTYLIERPYGILSYDTEKSEFRVVLMGEPTGAGAQSRIYDASRTERDISLEINKKQTIEILKKDVLNQHIERTVVNELLQNSLDSFGPKQTDREVSIEKTWGDNADTLTIHWSDNGVGMSPQVITDAFFTVGNVGTKGEESRGGYGFAKTGYLLAAEHIELVSTYRQKNGKFIRSTVTATRDQLYNGKFKLVSEEVFIAADKTGTKLSLTFQNDDFHLWKFSSELRDYRDKLRTPLAIRATGWGEAVTAQGETKTFDQHEQVHSAISVSHLGSDIKVYFEKIGPNDYHGYKTSGKYTIDTTTLNKGLPLQVGEWGFEGTLEKPDFAIRVDFTKTPLTKDANYPFLKNRTEILHEIEAEVRKKVNERIKNINRRHFEQEVSDFKKMVDEAPTIEGISILIPFKDQEDVKKATKVFNANREVFADIAKIYKKFQKVIASIGQKEPTLAVIVDPKVHGIRSVPEAVGLEINAINPFSVTKAFLAEPMFRDFLASGQRDIALLKASNFTHTLVHEYTHNIAPSDYSDPHGEPFTHAMGLLYAKMSHIRLAAELEEDLYGFYERHSDRIERIEADLRDLGKGGSKFSTNNSTLSTGSLTADGERLLRQDSAYLGQDRDGRVVNHVWDGSIVSPILNRIFHTAPPTGAQVTRDLEKDRTFVMKLFEMVDPAVHKVQVQVQKLQQQVQKLAGKPSKKKFYFGIGYQPKYKRSQHSDDLDRAMFLWRDIGGDATQINRFRTAAQAKLQTNISNERKLYLKKTLRVLDIAENLTPEQKDFALFMGDLFDDAARLANQHGLLRTFVDNYVRRIYNLPEAEKEQFAGLSGGSAHGFKTSFGPAEPRTYAAALDAILDGYELAVGGITTSYSSYMTELVRVISNKAFIHKGINTLDIGGNKLFTTNQKSLKRGYKKLEAGGFQVWTWAGEIEAEKDVPDDEVLTVDTYGRKFFATPPENIPEAWAVYAPGAAQASKIFDNEHDANAYAQQKGYTTIQHRRAKEQSKLFEKVPLYAPAPLADMINKATAHDSLFWQTPALQTILRLNAGVKSWILMSSFFHHLAGTRSYVFGVHHGWKKANPIQAYKDGLKKIEDMHPMVMFGVKNGLTLGEIQDWAEYSLAQNKGLTEKLLTHFGMEKPLKVVEYFKFKREQWADSLFKKYFAGLKAEAFAIEYAHELQKATDAYNRGLTHQAPDINRIAERVAREINEDFGGLHLQRMGRNPTLQKIGRLLLLAVDWTESNFRMVTGMMPGLNQKISKLVGDIPPPPGMEPIYRQFFGRVMLRIAVMTILAQLLLNGSDDSEEFIEEQMLSNRFGKLRWTEVEITKLYHMLGIDTEGQRKTFSIGGHFFDPLKLIDPFKLAKAKGSPFVRAVEATASGSDWAERPFTGVKELVTTGKTVKKSVHQEKESGLDRLPSVVVNQVVNMQPIQVGHMIKYLQGEEDALTALLQSGGAATHTVWKPKLETPIIAAKKGEDAAMGAVRAMMDVEDFRTRKPPSRYVQIKNRTYKMSRDQYDRYLDDSSEYVRKRLNGAIGSGIWDTWSDETKAKKLTAMINNSRKRTRDKVEREMRRDIREGKLEPVARLSS